MTYYVTRKIREKTLRVELDVWGWVELGDIMVDFNIEKVTHNGQPYEITTAERGELFRSINDDYYEIQRMASYYGDHLDGMRADRKAEAV